MHAEQKESLEVKIETIAKDGCGRIFDGKEAGERAQEILSLLKKYDFVSEADIDRAQEILEGIELVNERETFIRQALIAIKPLIEGVKANPEAFQRNEQERALSGDGKEKLNDLLFYNLDGDGNMHLHVLPNNFTTNTEKLSLLREGLKLVGQKLIEHSEVSTIYATSWIVAENPKLLEMLGFEVHGEIDESEREMIFSEEPREVWKASISREDFINRYV